MQISPETSRQDVPMPPPTKTLEPGSYTQAFCTRCKATLRHTIVALVDGVPKRVRCNTCGGEHVYRAPVESSEGADRPAPAKKIPSSRPTKQGTTEAAWTEQLTLAQAKGRHGRTYVGTDTYRMGDVMDHPAFGPGVVQRLLEPGKILVLFRTGARTLICGRKA
jgi:hypothetical protein